MSGWMKKPRSLLRLNGELGGVDEDSSFGDEAAALDAFRNHWKQAWTIMCTKSGSMNNTETQSANASLVSSSLLDGKEELPLSSTSSEGETESNSLETPETKPEPLNGDDVTSVVNHIEQMIQLLLQEYKMRLRQERRQQTLAPDHQSEQFESNPIMMSPLLDYLLMESILDKLFHWSAGVGEFTNLMKLEQLKLYELLVSELCHQSILFQTALIRPLLHLLSTCKDCAPLEVEKRLVNLLSTLCLLLSQNAELLELFFVNESHNRTNITRSMDEVKHSPAFKNRLNFLDSPESRFLIFSLLISFVHRDGSIGQQAREALLLIMSLSRKHQAIGVYIAEHSNFCPVLATGLSGLYSLLPRKLSTHVMQADDWHQLTSEDILEITELQNFLTSLRFCNAVVQVSHPLVKQQLLEYISQGFLVSVIAPALHQDIMHIPIEVLEKYPKFTNTIEEIIATTAYLELCLRTVTEPDLLQVFLRFVCMEKFDDQRILDTLISRIICNKKLCLVTIVLFRTLLDLNCEDVLCELVLKHLCSLNFLIDKNSPQLSLAGDCSQLDSSARRLLSYMPCVLPPPTQSQMAQLSVSDLERLEAISLSESLNDHSLNSIDSIERTERGLNITLASQALMENYIDYLNDAHRSIRACTRACVDWSCSYSFDNSAGDRNYDSGINISSLSQRDCSVATSSDQNGSVHTGMNTSQLNCTEDYFDVNSGVECEVIGPFLSNLLTKLENLHQNDVYTNLQLTGLWSRLLTFPQPVLRAYFFNDRVRINPRVRTLWRSLVKNQQRLQRLSSQRSDFSALLEKAKDYFTQRERLLLDRIESTNIDGLSMDNVEMKNSRSNYVTSEQITISIEPTRDNKRNTLRNFWNKLRNDKTSNSFQKEEIGFVPNRKMSNTSSKVSKPELSLSQAMSEPQRLALNVFIYQEFIKEISALCQEHYILDSEHSVGGDDSLQYASVTDLSNY